MHARLRRWSCPRWRGGKPSADDYIVALYELSGGGDPLNWANHQQIAQTAGIPEGDVMTVGQQVQGDLLVEFKTMGGILGQVAITAAGTAAAEQIILDAERAGAPRFASLVILTDVELRRKLEPLLGQLREAIENAPDLDPDVKSDLKTDVESADLQTRTATHPNRGVIKAALSRRPQHAPARGRPRNHRGRSVRDPPRARRLAVGW